MTEDSRIATEIAERLAPPRPQTTINAQSALRLVLLLLTAIVVMVISGPLIQWTGGRPFGIFDWLAIPSPLAKSELWHERLEVLHGWAAWTLIYLIGLHLLGVIKHQFIDRDGILARMTGRGSIT